MSKPLQIIYNLDGLSDEAIKQYMRDVSVHFDLDPEVNWFDVLWMQDPDTGLRRRQLYARRGTTDVLRDKRGISVTDMVHHDGPGFVSFTARGTNKAGRQEMAVGAHATDGLRGEKLAAAVATAETRAGRRLTLKFCGLGILDYTEVTDPVEIRATPDIEPVAQAPIFLPQFSIAPTPNAAPGKAVVKDDVAQAMAEAAEVGRKAAAILAAIPDPHPTVTVLRNDLPPGEYKGTIVERGDGLKLVVEPGQSTVVDNTPVAPEAPATPKTRRTRKKPNTVDLSAPGQVSANAEKAEPIEAFDSQGHGIGLVVPVSPSADIPKSQPSPTPAPNPFNDPYKASVPPQAAPAVPPQANPAVPTQVVVAAPLPPINLPPVPIVVTAKPHPEGMTMTMPNPGAQAAFMPTAAPQAATPVDFPGKPTAEQQATYREELRAYSNIILPSAGMVPSANIGGPSVKLRMYAERMAGKTTQEMTVDDWEDFFTQMKQFREKNGDKGLVKYINDVIGAK